MPPKVKFTREEIIRAALDIVRETGPEGLTARSLAARLGCSVKPIFGLFRSMEEVQQEVLAAGYRLYGQTIAQAMEAGKYPPYKASGMAYIAFAQQEKPLFRLLFMRDRSHEDASPRLGDDVEPLLDLCAGWFLGGPAGTCTGPPVWQRWGCPCRTESSRPPASAGKAPGCSTWRCGSMSMASPPWRPRRFWTGTRSSSARR